MSVYAVIDTNVLVSALLSKKEDAATVRVIHELFGGRIVPLYHRDILRDTATCFTEADSTCSRTPFSAS